MALARLKVFGWGREGEGMTAEEEACALDVIADAPVQRLRQHPDADAGGCASARPRIAPPATLAAICSTDIRPSRAVRR